MSPFTFDFSTLDKTLMTFVIVSYCFAAIGKYFMFHKVKENGYNGVLPIYSDYILFAKCWDERGFWAFLASFVIVLGLPYLSDAPMILASLASIAFCIMVCLYSLQLARAFGKGYPHLILVCIIPIAATLLKFSNVYVFIGLLVNPFLMLALGLDKTAKYLG